MSKAKKDCKSSKKTCSICKKTYANGNSLSSHKSAYHKKPKLEETMEPLVEEDVKIQEPETVKYVTAEEVEIKQEPEDVSDSESFTVEDVPKTTPLEKYGGRTEFVRQRTKNSLGKLSYKLDPSFDLMDAYEVKNLFIKLKEDCVTSKQPFSGRYMLFIDAIVELSSLNEICYLLNSRAVMLKNIFKKLEQKSGLWNSRIRSFRLNVNY